MKSTFLWLQMGPLLLHVSYNLVQCLEMFSFHFTHDQSIINVCKDILNEWRNTVNGILENKWYGGDAKNQMIVLE